MRPWVDTIERSLCGAGIHVKPWHFQYTAVFYLHRDLKRLLRQYGGNILDVGCGEKPYRGWFGQVSSYIGIDVYQGEQVDVVIEPCSRWPLPESAFDVALCTQVLEHVTDLHLTLSEIHRVLRPGGTVIASFPFLYNEHGIPHDYRRFSAYGAQQLFADWEVQLIQRQGAIGTTLNTLFLNWLYDWTNQWKGVRWLRRALLPGWMLFCLLCNVIALIVDRVDTTGRFYNNVLVVARKPHRSEKV